MTFIRSSELQQLRRTFPIGTRVILISIKDEPYSKVQPGDKGTVQHVDDAGTIHVRWDNKGSLGALWEVDRVAKL